MPAIMQPKTVNVVSLAAQRKAPQPKPAMQAAADTKVRKTFFDYLRIALSGQMA